nr:MAG TPA: hypothetical protein [Caudoviricetes sp.]
MLVTKLVDFLTMPYKLPYKTHFGTGNTLMLKDKNLVRKIFKGILPIS